MFKNVHAQKKNKDILLYDFKIDIKLNLWGTYAWCMKIYFIKISVKDLCCKNINLLKLFLFSNV